jgi:phosphate starvation-inducible protein PhoH and related proteins
VALLVGINTLAINCVLSYAYANVNYYLKLLKKIHYSQTVRLMPVDNRRLAILCGKFDENLREIEKVFNIELSNRGHEFQIIGEKPAVLAAARLLDELYAKTSKGMTLSDESFQLSIRSTKNRQGLPPASIDIFEKSSILLKRGLVIQPQTEKQHQYIENIQHFPITFGIGPAGTGKSYLAVACAVEALEKEQIKRILLIRPVVEAGERLGFLPGDLGQKIDPYLRPLYDALYEMVGFEQVTRLVERRVIEIAPLAFMRGRTLNDSFVILDEAQNTTREQMKMLLTRLGFNTFTVVTGDITQTDLPAHTPSGLRHVLQVLEGIPEIAVTYFTTNDVVRHPLVQAIIEAYEKYEAKT